MKFFCDDCRDAWNQYQRERRHARWVADGSPPPKRSRQDLVPPNPSDHCGTRYGYNRHYRKGEHPCDECRDANRKGIAEWRARQKRSG